MYKYDRNDSLVSWMIAGGPRFDLPDPRHVLHLVALRDAKQESSRSISPLAWLATRFGARPAATAMTAAAVIASTGAVSTTGCCAPA